MQEHEKVSQAVNSAFTLDPDKWAIEQITAEELNQCEKAFELIVDTLDGVFTGHQECLLIEMREALNEELNKMEMEDYGRR